MNYKSILGLSTEQAKIVASLIKQSKNISQISRDTNVPRTSILAHLNKLHSRKIVTKEKVGKRILWKTNNVEEIEKQFYKNLSELKIKNSGNQIKILQSSNEAKIIYYHGTKSIYQIWKHLSNLSKHNRIYGIQSDTSFKTATERLQSELPMKTFLKINEDIKKNKIIVEALVHEKTVETLAKSINKKYIKQFFESFQGRLTDTSKLPDNFLDINAEVYMNDDTLYLVNWEALYAISIEDRELSTLFKGLFDSLKHLCERYDQGARMAKKVVDLTTSS